LGSTRLATGDFRGPTVGGASQCSTIFARLTLHDLRDKNIRLLELPTPRFLRITLLPAGLPTSDSLLKMSVGNIRPHLMIRLIFALSALNPQITGCSACHPTLMDKPTHWPA
jgi:hypothetical protein